MAMLFVNPSEVLSLYKKFDTLERGMNVLGYIPIVGSITGGVGRRLFGVTQTVAGLAIGVFSCLLFVFNDPHASFYGPVAVTLIAHGLLNGIRSEIEIKPFLPLFLLLPMDIFIGRMFQYPQVLPHYPV